MKIIKGFAEDTTEIATTMHSVKIVLANGIRFRIRDTHGHLEVTKEGNDYDSLSVMPMCSNCVWVK